MDACPFVSIIMPLRNEAAFLSRSLGSVLAQDYPHARLEVLVADGMSTDETRGEIGRLAANSDIAVTVVENARRIVSTGLNALLRRARGEIVIRVDGHCEIASDYVSFCVRHLERGEAEGVGGALETVGETPVARVIARAMSSGFGVGGSPFRTRKGWTGLVDTVAFPAYTHAAIEVAGPYDEELVRNQDDEYNYRLRSRGARILVASDVKARYYSRSSLRSLFRQYFQYGLWKVRVLQKHPRQMRPRQFVPPAFVACVLVGALAAPMAAWARFGFIGVVGAYTLANLAASAWTGRAGPFPEVFLLPFVFAMLHFSYGVGFLTGLVRFRDRWRDTATRQVPAVRDEGRA
jgi:succinoglycan biosynthesis protein ExoA